jgi:hypothetical protein
VLSVPTVDLERAVVDVQNDIKIGEVAMIQRSDNTWKYAKLLRRDGTEMEFIVDSKGTSKIVLEAYYTFCIKRCNDKVEDDKVAAAVKIQAITRKASAKKLVCETETTLRTQLFSVLFRCIRKNPKSSLLFQCLGQSQVQQDGIQGLEE